MCEENVISNYDITSQKASEHCLHVGKHCLLNLYEQTTYNDYSISTIGVDEQSYVQPAISSATLNARLT